MWWKNLKSTKVFFKCQLKILCNFNFMKESIFKTSILKNIWKLLTVHVCTVKGTQSSRIRLHRWRDQNKIENEQIHTHAVCLLAAEAVDFYQNFMAIFVTIHIENGPTRKLEFSTWQGPFGLQMNKVISTRCMRISLLNLKCYKSVDFEC